jgi:hypothetical protein
MGEERRGEVIARGMRRRRRGGGLKEGDVAGGSCRPYSGGG